MIPKGCQPNKYHYPLIDSYRGFALLCMFFYHGCLFSKEYGLLNSTIPNDFSWIIFQKFIAGSFFFLVGINVFLCCTESFDRRKFYLRWGQIVFCAMIVTLTSMVLYQSKVITFGILHSIAVCQLFNLACLRFKLVRMAIPLGIFVVIIGIFYKNSFFNHPLLQWIGLSTGFAETLDLQPIFPWLGVSLLGLALAPYIENLCKKTSLPNNWIIGCLSLLGRHTLFLYMLHVPVILGSLALITSLSGTQ